MNVTLPERFDFEALWRYTGAPDDITREKAERVVRQLYKVCKPKEVHREYAVVPDTDGICLIGTGFVFSGKNIARHLSDCDACIVSAVTLGMGADSLVRTIAVTDMASSVLCDSAASVLIEQVSAGLENLLHMEYAERGLHLTESYSPGYGDFPLETNKLIDTLLLLNRRIGLTVTDDFLMLPRKSITSVIGISDRIVKGSRATCESCKLFDKCTLRKEGKHCGSR